MTENLMHRIVRIMHPADFYELVSAKRDPERSEDDVEKIELSGEDLPADFPISANDVEAFHVTSRASCIPIVADPEIPQEPYLDADNMCPLIFPAVALGALGRIPRISLFTPHNTYGEVALPHDLKIGVPGFARRMTETTIEDHVAFMGSWGRELRDLTLYSAVQAHYNRGMATGRIILEAVAADPTPIS